MKDFYIFLKKDIKIFLKKLNYLYGKNNIKKY